MSKHMFVVCAYKESPYLDECVSSLENQTISSEIIMITSTPNSYIQDIAHKHNIPLIINRGESGIGPDWNFGVAQCQSDIVTIAHQDDTYAPDYVKSVLEQYEKNKDALIIFTDYGEIRNAQICDNSSLTKVKRMLLSPLKLNVFSRNKFVRRRILGLGNAICCPSVTYVLGNLEMPIFEEDMKSNLDWETWERLSRKRGAFIYIPRILMHHRIHEESTTSELINDNKRVIEDYEMFRKFWPSFIARVICRVYSKGEKYNEV